MSSIIKIPVCILVRVSTDDQSNSRQIKSLHEYADKNDYHVVEIIEEKISGVANSLERTGLERAEELARAGMIKKVLVHEISRISRKNSQNHLFLEEMEKLGVSIYWSQHNMETLLPDGSRNPSASILFSLMSEIFRQERETLVSRIRSGMMHSRDVLGNHIGRPTGTTLCAEELLVKHSDIVKQVKKKKSVRDIAKIVGKGTTTVSRIKRIMKDEGILPA